MLTENDFKLIEKQASKLYGDLELEIIQEIAERIANVGYANTVVYNDAKILQEMGTLYEDIISMVAEHNEKSYSQIYSIFQEAGIKSLKYDDTIYKLAGLSPKGLSKSMEQLLSATARKTNNNLNNLTMTTAATSQTQFLNAMNKAYMEVSTGVKSYSTSIIDTIKEISNQGAYVEYPSGAHRSLESAVRTNIITSVNQTSGKLQELRAEEMDWDLVEVSAHSGARPEHAEWQGKVYSLRGETKGYKTLEEGCDYGRVTGLCGANCRHTFFPYYKGSARTYTNQELYELKNEKVEYNGQLISKYDASQIQRKMERNIRQNKKDIAGFQGILASNNSDIDIEQTRKDLKIATNNLRTNNSTLNDFVKQTGFRKENSRLYSASSEIKIKGTTKINQITPELEDFIKKYTNGQYDFACEYSQMKIEGTEEEKIIRRLKNEYNITDIELNKKIKNTQNLMNIIEKQETKNIELVRIQKSHKYIDDKNVYEDYKIGDIFDWGIRSTSKDVNFAEKVFNGDDEGVSLSKDIKYTEFRIVGNKKSFDIDKYSEYSQSESLIAGRFEVLNVEYVKAQNIYDDVSEFQIYMKENPERFEKFTSKKGKIMTRDLKTNKTYTEFQTKTGYFDKKGDFLSNEDLYNIQEKINKETFKRQIVTIRQVL